MKTTILTVAAGLLLVCGCAGPRSLSQQASEDERFPNQEPFSKSQFETIYDPAGAASQAEKGIYNPFLVPKAGRTQKVYPQNPLPPPRP